MSEPSQPPVAPESRDVAARGVVSTGWLAANSTFAQPDKRKLAPAVIVSLAAHVGGLFVVLLLMTMAPESPVAFTPPVEHNVIYVEQAGPGGGGGGSPAPAPPKQLEIPKPVAPPPTPIAVVTVPVVAPPPPPPSLNAPVETNMATVLQTSGLSSVSLADRGGGGRGVGAGPDVGDGLGPGRNGGTGGKEFDLGSGVESPVPIRKPDPKYTAEAMRARITGEVHLDAVVMANGTVQVRGVLKSLDKTFGLDQAAIDAAKTWVFRPGTLNGVPVNVKVRLIMEFRLQEPGLQAPESRPAP